MSQTLSPGIDALRGWIGRAETASDIVTPRLVRELNAALDSTSDIAPLALHWCLAPRAAPASYIGRDGHPQRGGFLPPVSLPRRMWASGKLTFHGHLATGDTVERHSTIADVTVKEGRTGTLCFVAVDHEIISPRGLAITERQDIVYRELTPHAPETKPPRPAELPAPQWRRELRADPVLLFRYSALTFNGHRIHYDRDFAMTQEFYPGLVVHGPLQATLLLAFAAECLNRPPAYFEFRGVNPLFDFQSFDLGAVKAEDGLHLWVVSEDGVQTMDARAR